MGERAQWGASNEQAGLGRMADNTRWLGSQLSWPEIAIPAGIKQAFPILVRQSRVGICGDGLAMGTSQVVGQSD